MASFADVLAGLETGLERRGKLPVMRVLMATLTAQVGEMELPVGVAFAAGHDAVAIQTGHRLMRSPQGKADGLMPGKREGRRTEGLHRVALLATVVERRAGELTAVGILMAIGASLESGVIVGVDPGRCMTLCTRDSPVLPG